jgi:spore coat protein U-like protein
MSWKRLFIAVALVSIGVASPASAQPAPSCTISTTSVNFGTYNVFSGTPLDSTGTITYRCNAAAANITIALTQGTSGTYSPRNMSKGVELLSYNLYTNAARTVVWGDGTAGTATHFRANPPNNSNVNVTVFARVPAGQDISVGSFSDTVSATINF